MDSIFEQPRVTPIPLSKKEVTWKTKPTVIDHSILNGFIPPVPLVPEVSMIFQNNTAMQNGNDSMYLTYNAWKARNQNNVGFKNVSKESVAPFRSNTDSFTTKQVRFEGERNQMFNTPVNVSTTPVSDGESRFARSKTKPFEQIYMANIPDRHLDLSVIESPKKLRPKENHSPNVNLGFHTSTLYQQNFTNHNKRNNEEDKVRQIRDRIADDPLSKNEIIDMYNYKRDTDTHRLPYTFRHISNDIKSNDNYQLFSSKCSIGTQTENNLCEIKRSREDEPTVKDLLTIIQQQNNQLLILQKQISMLLNSKEQQLQNGNVTNDYCTHVESQKIDICKNIPQLGLQSRQQYSVEVSIRRQQNLNQAGKDATHTPKICEVIEENSPGNILSGIPKNNEFCGESYENGLCTIDGSVHVPQPCPSPEGSIDYGSVEEYSEDSEDEQHNSEKSFIEGQVNHILKESGINPNNNGYSKKFHRNSADHSKVDRLKKRVLDATLKQLHKLGVEVPIKENIKVKSNETNKEFEKEVSFIVEQLLMKLLPNEHLAKLTYKHTQTVTSPVKCKQNNLIQRRPEFSLASMQYLRKYNLLTDSSGHIFTKHNQISTPKRQDHGPGKFLDVTELRQLSKLPDKDK